MGFIRLVESKDIFHIYIECMNQNLMPKFMSIIDQVGHFMQKDYGQNIKMILI